MLFPIMADVKKEQPKRGKRTVWRRLAWTFVSVLLLVVSALTGAWVFRIPIAERLAGPVFGVPGLELVIDRLDFSGFVAREISLGRNGRCAPPGLRRHTR